MSTKIGHGYLLDPTCDPLDFLTTARPALTAVAERLDRDLIAQEATILIDAAYLTGGELPTHPARTAQRALRRSVDAQAAAPDPHNVEIVFLAHRGQRAALLYTGAAEQRAAFEALPGVTWYGYWDNTDRPDDVTAADWQARRVFWDEILGHQVPASAGVVWKLRTYPLPGPALVSLGAPIPAARDRARLWAGRALLEAAMDGTDPVRWFGHVAESMGEPAADDLTGYVEALLPPLTADDLNGPVGVPALPDDALEALRARVQTTAQALARQL